jgi:hypothetical protein
LNRSKPAPDSSADGTFIFDRSAGPKPNFDKVLTSRLRAGLSIVPLRCLLARFGERNGVCRTEPVIALAAGAVAEHPPAALSVYDT